MPFQKRLFTVINYGVLRFLKPHFSWTSPTAVACRHDDYPWGASADSVLKGTGCLIYWPLASLQDHSIPLHKPKRIMGHEADPSKTLHPGLKNGPSREYTDAASHVRHVQK